MKKKLIIYVFIILCLVSCNRKQKEYKSRNVEIETVFDSSSNYSYSDKNQAIEYETNSQYEIYEDETNSQTEIYEDEANNQNEFYETSTVVNLRETPTTQEDNYIKTIPENSQVDILESVDVEGELWYKISFDGDVGFIRSDLIR